MFRKKKPKEGISDNWKMVMGPPSSEQLELMQKLKEEGKLSAEAEAAIVGQWEDKDPSHKLSEIYPQHLRYLAQRERQAELQTWAAGEHGPQAPEDQELKEALAWADQQKDAKFKDEVKTWHERNLKNEMIEFKQDHPQGSDTMNWPGKEDGRPQSNEDWFHAHLEKTLPENIRRDETTGKVVELDPRYDKKHEATGFQASRHERLFHSLDRDTPREPVTPHPVPDGPEPNEPEPEHFAAWLAQESPSVVKGYKKARRSGDLARLSHFHLAARAWAGQ